VVPIAGVSEHHLRHVRDASRLELDAIEAADLRVETVGAN
jgi:hypothetical protein